jgi:hypothetical protein
LPGSTRRVSISSSSIKYLSLNFTLNSDHISAYCRFSCTGVTSCVHGRFLMLRPANQVPQDLAYGGLLISTRKGQKLHSAHSRVVMAQRGPSSAMSSQT